MSTQFIMRFNGGPQDGTITVDDSEYKWPPPEELPFVSGDYRRVSFASVSRVDPVRDRIARSVDYDWHPFKAKE